MRIAVTGASGFIGRELVPALAHDGHTGWAVCRRALDRLPAGWKALNREDILHPTPARTGGETPRPDLLIHLEAKHHAPHPSHRDRREFEAVNVRGTASWLEWCGATGVKRFVFFSTIKAVGESAICQDEMCALPPTTEYGRSKAAAERLVSNWVQGDPSRMALILRPGVVYGPGNQANILALIRAIDRGFFFLIEANENVKSMISLRNLVGAVRHLISQMQPGSEVFNVVDRESYSIRQIAAMVRSLLGKSGKPMQLPMPLARVAAKVGDLAWFSVGRELPLTSSRLAALLETTHFSCAKLLSTGFNHPQSTEEGLREMVTWYLQSKVRLDKGSSNG